jgi:hypothetical protein
MAVEWVKVNESWRMYNQTQVMTTKGEAWTQQRLLKNWKPNEIVSAMQ